MNYLAEATVHTSGLNIESIVVTASIILGIVGSFVTWIGNKITRAINDMSEKLQAKLESKEVVQQINNRLTRVEQSLADIRENTK